MHQPHHTLKQDLTKTLLIWGSSFFALLSILFSLSFHSFENYILELLADHRLDYQSIEFDRHLKEHDMRIIIEESETLVQSTVFAAIVLTDGKGNTLASTINTDIEQLSRLKKPLTAITANDIVKNEGALHLYARQLPNQSNTIYLIMDDRTISGTIIKVSVFCGLLLLTLLLISIKALHYSLRRQLVEPVEQLRNSIENNSVNATTLKDLEETLPDEASDILGIFEELKHSNDEMKTHIIEMMETLPACFWWSHDGKSYSGVSNKATTVLDKSPDDIQGTELWLWTEDPSQLSSNHLQLQQAIRQQDDKLDFAYQIEKDGQSFWYGESVTICYHMDGTLDTVYGIINDISVRKTRQQEQAERLEMEHRMAAAATLVGGIAHEFNNALAGMNGNLFLLKQNTDNDKNKHRIRRIEQLIQHSASMVDHMLIFACKNTRKAGPVKLIEFLNSFQTSLLPELQERTELNLSFSQNCDGIEPVILADQKRLHEVLLQLLNNAVYAVKESDKPQINIKVDSFNADNSFLRQHPHITSRDIVHIQIQDNGCGIPKDLHERIFEPFFTTREVGEGTGLGLSMVYGYIRQIGGAIDLNSGIDTGSTFQLYLPASKSIGDAIQGASLLQGHGETILAVDDNHMFRESTREVLERMGYTVIEAENGKQAINLFKQHKHQIRLVLMDILMPGLTGIQASRQIREVNPDIPVIFLTAYDRTHPLEPEVYENNSELINKPFSIPVLFQAIHKVLKAHAE